jgi:hypothetical protein
MSSSKVQFDIHALRENCPSTRMIDKEIENMLAEIKAQIYEAHKNKARQIKYTLKTNYDIPNTTNKDAQTEIWGRLISTLKDDWLLNVAMRHIKEKDSYYLEIKWITKADEDKKKLYMSYINSALHNSSS